LWDDTRAVVRAPGSWNAAQWTEAGLGAAGVVAGGFLLDHAVDQAVLRNDHASWRSAARDVAQLGGVGGLALIGAGYLGSGWLGQDKARAMWTDAGIGATLARATAFTLQVAVGRDRPSEGKGAGAFSPFSSQDSFPSGHASQAFAMASAISMHSDNPWAGGAAYGMAGLVGLARLETRDHFTSDVLAGALVGTTVGRAVVRINQDRRNRATPRAELSVAPAWSRDYRGLAVVARF
jgi:membrane-associated phospholipid phosphatase